MKKPLLLLSLLLSLVMGCSATVKPAHGPSERIKHMAASTTSLILSDEEGPSPYCTAVWVDEYTMITANHCVEMAWMDAVEKRLAKLDDDEKAAELYRLRHLSDAERRALSVVNTKIYYIVQGDADDVGKEPFAIRMGKVVAVDNKHDIALVQAMGHNLPSHDIARLAAKTPEIGDKMSTIGQVHGLYWTYVEGVVAAYRDTLPEERSINTKIGKIQVLGPFMQVSAPVWYGNSGGGAFDADGKLVGIASFLTGAPHSCYFIHLDAIRDLLKANKIK